MHEYQEMPTRNRFQNYRPVYNKDDSVFKIIYVSCLLKEEFEVSNFEFIVFNTIVFIII